MYSLGLHVPSGFVITTETCNDFFKENKVMPPDFEHKLIASVHDIERRTGRIFGEKSGKTFPLLLSVRKAAPYEVEGCVQITIFKDLYNPLSECLIPFLMWELTKVCAR